MTYKKKRNIRNRVCSIMLVASLCAAIPLQVGATTAQKKQNAQQGLDATNQKIDQLENEAGAVDAQLSEKTQQLADILSAQASLEVEISATEDAIAQTESDLAVAQEKAQTQYDNMKLRIQFMYESSVSDSYWTAILGAKGIADLLNRVEYVKEVEKADRQMLDAYEATVAEIEGIKVALEEQHKQLMEMKAAYDKQQEEVEVLVAQLKKESANYAAEIASAKKEAEKYKKEIEEANRKLREEEEARAKAAAAAAAAAAQNNKNDKNDGGSGNSSDKTGINPSNSTGVNGQDIVNYALQFVGGPYIWAAGHYSTLSARQNYNISNGVDCSGFVSCVYAHFGIMTPNYSISFAYGGKEVSPDCMQPGDVIVYGYKNSIGHVAIYMGNGKIVEAQSTETGITSGRAWNNREVIAIRRYV